MRFLEWLHSILSVCFLGFNYLVSEIFMNTLVNTLFFIRTFFILYIHCWILFDIDFSSYILLLFCFHFIFNILSCLCTRETGAKLIYKSGYVGWNIFIIHASNQISTAQRLFHRIIQKTVMYTVHFTIAIVMC